MSTYISFLRGINVGGHRKILMADLKKIYEELKLKNVSTYIQSGNVVFSTSEKINTKVLSNIIERGIAEKTGFDVPVIIRTYEQLQDIILKNPFLKNTNISLDKCYVTFLSEQPLQKDSDRIIESDFNPDEFIFIGQDVFLHIPDKYGNTKLSNDFFEKKLKVKATSRNWKTLTILVEMAKNNNKI